MELLKKVLLANPCYLLMPLFLNLEQQLKGPTVVFFYGGDYNQDFLSCLLQKVTNEKPVIVMKVPEMEGSVDFVRKGDLEEDEEIEPYSFKIGKITTSKRFTASSTVLFVDAEHIPHLRMALPLWNPKSDVLSFANSLRDYNGQLPGLKSMFRCIGAVMVFVYQSKPVIVKGYVDLNGIFTYEVKAFGTAIFSEPGKKSDFKFLKVISDFAPPLATEDGVSGVEQKILNTVCKHLDIEVQDYLLELATHGNSRKEVAKKLSYGYDKGKDYNFIASFMYLHLNHAHVLIGNLIYPWSTAIILDLGTPYMETSLVWYVPSPVPQITRRAYAVVEVFSVAVWSGFLMTYFGILLIMSVDISRHKRKSTIAFLETTALAINQPVSTNKSNIQIFSSFIFSVYFFILHTSTAYQAILIESFSTVPRDSGYKKMEDLVPSNLSLIINDGHETLLSSFEDNPVLSELKKKNPDFSFEINPQLVADGKHALLGPSIVNDYALHYGESNSSNLFDEYDQPLISVMREPVTSYLVGLYYSPWFPLKDKMNDVTQTLVEAGLPNLWLKQFYTNKRNVFKWDRGFVNKPYSLTDVGFVFGFFLVALPASLFVFLVELGCYFFKKPQGCKRNMKNRNKCWKISSIK